MLYSGERSELLHYLVDPIWMSITRMKINRACIPVINPGLPRMTSRRAEAGSSGALFNPQVQHAWNVIHSPKRFLRLRLGKVLSGNKVLSCAKKKLFLPIHGPIYVLSDRKRP